MSDREKKIAEIRVKVEFLDGCESKVEIDSSAIAQDYKFLLSELDRVQQEYTEERAAHNAHATELCLQDQEIKRLHAEIERLRARAERMNYTEKDIKTAMTRELTDERVAVAAAYWLDASPHERWEPDGIILARYARHAMAEIERLRAALEEALEALEWIRDAGTDYQSINKARQAIQSIRGSGADVGAVKGGGADRA